MPLYQSWHLVNYNSVQRWRVLSLRCTRKSWLQNIYKTTIILHFCGALIYLDILFIKNSQFCIDFKWVFEMLLVGK